MWAWVKKVEAWFEGNPKAMAIIHGLANDLKNASAEMLPFIEQTCLAALTVVPGGGAAKLAYVVAQVMAKFPTVEKSLATTMVQTVYNYIVAPTLPAAATPAPEAPVTPTT